MAAELWELIQEENAMACPSDLARQQWRLTPLFVKNVPHLTMHRRKIASLLPRELGEVSYKTATVQARSGDEVMAGARSRFATVRAVWSRL
jgi:hypothetical protein